MVSLLASIVWLALWCFVLWRSRRTDARRLRNGFYVAAVVYCVFAVVGEVISFLPGGGLFVGWAVLTLLLGILLSLFLLPFVLIANGLTMFLRERRTLPNLMSLVAGLLLLAFPLIDLGLVAAGDPWAIVAAMLLTFVAAWLGFMFFVFVVQTLAYARYARRVEAGAVIVLGSRVIDGRVPPLLASRLAVAMRAAAEAEARTGRPVTFVPSGGRGTDEALAEGEAMAVWLREHGVEEARILVEDRARTTRENLRFSLDLLREHGVLGDGARVLAATNDYHAPRAALEAHDEGFDVDVIGGRTARYYFPSAYLREFVAVLRARKRGCLVVGAIIAVLVVLTGVFLVFPAFA